MTEFPALAVDHLSFAFATRRALDDVSFSLRRGECMILLGPNGAGKSTLFSLITRLYAAPSGSIEINGFDVKHQSCKALAQLGVVFQQTTLDQDLSVMQNLRYHTALHGIGRKQANHQIQLELERQGMYDRRFEKVKQLNGGHRRRVEIARALLHQPSLLLLDEPTVGLDLPSRQGIVEHVHALCEETRTAVLWATHLIDEIGPDDQLVVLHQGLIRATGSVDEVQQFSGTETIRDAFYQLTDCGKKAA